MEHLNHRLKTILRGMGANITPSRIKKAGESLEPVHRICEIFERQNSFNYSRCHLEKTFILNVLVEKQVFHYTPGRHHPSFKFKSIFETHTKPELITKINTSLMAWDG